MDAADLMFAGPGRQAEMVRAKEISPRELVQASLDRIAALDPQLNAFRIVLAEQALEEAERAPEGPLRGVPVAIKDDLDIAGQLTCMGTNAYGAPKTADSELVRILRAAGAIPVGKTNVPELFIHPFTETPTFGATRNPWDLQRAPGGSSGGSAAAVASGMVGVAVGSDGAGSIRIPAACCGLVGLKPSRGRVTTAPRHEPWQGMDTWGGLARTAADAALFLDVVKTSGPSFAEAVAIPPERLRVAVIWNPPPGSFAKPDAEYRSAVESTVELLRDAGHEVFEDRLDYGNAGYWTIVRYFRGIADDIAELEHPERLARNTKGYVRIGRMLPDALVQRARRGEAEDRQRLGRIFERADVVLTPAFTHRPFPIGKYATASTLATFNADLNFTPYTGPWNHMGNPAIGLPAGFAADGFPLAVHFVGRPDDEATLLSLAAQLEAVRGWPERRPPVS